MIPKMHIHLLGDFRLTFVDAPVRSLNAPRLQSLLAYLVLHRNPATTSPFSSGLTPAKLKRAPTCGNSYTA